MRRLCAEDPGRAKLDGSRSRLVEELGWSPDGPTQVDARLPSLRWYLDLDENSIIRYIVWSMALWLVHAQMKNRRTLTWISRQRTAVPLKLEPSEKTARDSAICGPSTAPVAGPRRRVLGPSRAPAFLASVFAVPDEISPSGSCQLAVYLGAPPGIPPFAITKSRPCPRFRRRACLERNSLPCTLLSYGNH